MFINCPYCRTLVSTDPVTDLPPTHCPHCMSLLRRDATVEDDEDADAAPLDLVALMNTPIMETGTAAGASTAMATEAQAPAAAGAPLQDEIAAGGDAVAESSSGPVDAALAGMAGMAGPSDTPPGTLSSPSPNTTPSAASGRRGARAMPSFARGASAANQGPRERWAPAAVAALALLLALQLLLADRARLAASAHWRPTLHALCAVFFCELPPWREPAAFTLLQRDVRQHPSIPGALRVSATFRNDARWPQPWPRLRLTLSDANGRPAGERDFRADDYLGGPASQPELASGESATVAMDILEPAPQIVGYDFSFR